MPNVSNYSLALIAILNVQPWANIQSKLKYPFISLVSILLGFGRLSKNAKNVMINSRTRHQFDSSQIAFDVYKIVR